MEQFWYGCDLIGLLLRFELAYDKPSLLRAPGREHVQGRGRRGAMKGRFDRFPLQRDACVLGELCHGLRLGQKALPKPLGLESGQHATEGIVRGNPMWQGKERLEPGLLALTKKCHILAPFPTSEERAYGHDQAIEPLMFLCPLNAWVFSGLKMRDDRGVDGVSHAACSSPEGTDREQHSIGNATGVAVSLG